MHNIQNSPREILPTTAAPIQMQVPKTAAPARQLGDRFERQGNDIRALAELVATLQDRIASLEKRVGVLVEEETFAPVPLGQLARAGASVWQPAPAAPVPGQPAAEGATSQPSAQPGPEAPTLSKPGEKSHPSPTAPIYTVQPGDTLWGIATRELGDPRRFHEIVQANAKRHPALGSSPDYLKPGWKLELPGAYPPARPTAHKPTEHKPGQPGATKPAPEMPPTHQPTKPVKEKPAAPLPEPNRPAGVSEATLKMRSELDFYLKENTNSGAVVALLKDHPEYVDAATPQQKSALVRQVIKPLIADKKDRATALRILEAAASQGELSAVMTEIHGKKKLYSLFNKLGGSEQGRALQKLLHTHGGLPKAEMVAAMNSASVSDLLVSLGWKHPVIGTSDTLRGLPEAHKLTMVEKLVGGDFTQTDHRQATWLNRHLERPVRLPEYDPHATR